MVDPSRSALLALQCDRWTTRGSNQSTPSSKGRTQLSPGVAEAAKPNVPTTAHCDGTQRQLRQLD